MYSNRLAYGHVIIFLHRYRDEIMLCNDLRRGYVALWFTIGKRGLRHNFASLGLDHTSTLTPDCRRVKMG